MIYKQEHTVEIPQLDLLTFLFESPECAAREDTPLHAEASDPSNAVTKSQARTLTRQIAFALRQRYGIGAGKEEEEETDDDDDIVVTLSTGQSGLPLLFYGVVAAGGIYSAGNPAATPEDLARQIRDGPAKLLVCSADVRPLATAAADLAGLAREKILVLESSGAASTTAAGGGTPIQLQGLDGEAACALNEELAWRRITDPEDLARSRICILYSSGTTGRPKGVVVSHANMVAEAYLPASINRPIWARWASAAPEVVGGSRPRPRPFASRTLAHLPAAHVSGVQGYFVNPFFDGGVVYWMPRFDFAAFLAHCAALRITTLFSLPRVYLALARHPAVTDQLAALRIAYSGGTHLPAEVLRSEKFGGGKKGEGEDERTLLSQTWGASETTGAVTHMPPDRRDESGSVGELLPNMLLRLVDENDADVAPGEAGEALLKGPVITRGYHRNAEADALGFTPDGWFRTGDVVQIRGDLLYVVGRRKEIINYHGAKVAPAELEAILCEHPSVADAAVLGVPGEETEVPRALVALRADAKATGKEEELMAFVAERVSEWKRLRGGVGFVETVPRLPSGKIWRAKLKEMAEVRGN
ncbi:hypothetical protein F4778DRAFT_44358 [Xylariomycetidae sp. FL2044]|nr:hypothetical protein F4778DRAFT_44358 [Xylariomycetidae sp. FL2044]